MNRSSDDPSYNPLEEEPPWEDVEENRRRFKDADQGEDTMAKMGFISPEDNEPDIDLDEDEPEGWKAFALALGTALVAVPAALWLTLTGLTAVPLALLALAGAVLVAYLRP